MNQSDELTWSLLTHVGPLLISFLSVPGFLFPLVVMFTKGKQSERVRRESVEALNFHLNVLAYGMALLAGVVGTGVFSLLNQVNGELPETALLFIGAFIVLGLVAFVMPIVAASRIAANKAFRYPMIFRVVK